jgi:hypothetical protein
VGEPTSLHDLRAGLVILIMAAIFIFIDSNAYQAFSVDHISFGSSLQLPDRFNLRIA